MKSEEVHRIIHNALDRLDAALAEGHSEALSRLLAAMARFHRYSWGNVVLIASQRPDATRVAGFHAWKRLGRSVKAGERGIAIRAPMLYRRSSGQGGPDDEEEALRFRLAHVFDITQTEGEPPPEIESPVGAPGSALPRLLSFAEQCGIVILYEELVGAEGVSSGGTVRIQRGLAPAEEFSTLVHEIAHELLHQGPDAVRDTRTVRETEAEAVAHVVCQAVGIGSTAASRDYIHLHQGDRELLARSLRRIQRAAAAILERVLTESPPVTPAPPRIATGLATAA